MSNIPSSAQYIQIEGAQTRSPDSESLIQTIGGTENYLLDQNTANTAAHAALSASIAAIAADVASRPKVYKFVYGFGASPFGAVVASSPNGKQIYGALLFDGQSGAGQGQVVQVDPLYPTIAGGLVGSAKLRIGGPSNSQIIHTDSNPLGGGIGASGIMIYEA